ncbi:glutamate--cysteine ligase [Actinokineospora auranticolor]|uniref:Putative glutamate--cysteine ligase 2 n=1 Tax=Actinokineospora auranticolor TaxID=155976 RepID=A0A2S6H0B7_9PSEU|nr:glutamate--cysteine ligase [Actinokineospora auranticolor]PPK70871.1 carboxylate-amine ligase [Actinokineospora auranticolor]
MAEQDYTVGVEEEFFLVDADGDLVDQGPEAVAGITDVDLKPELLRCQVESATGVLRHAEEIRGELAALRARLADAAAERDAVLIAAGTVPHAQRDISEIGPGTRYHRIARHVGPFIFADLTCGCHVHVGVEDRAAGLRVANHLRPWLPALLAVSGNSAFQGGVDTGYASTRHVLWGRWPSAGPPPYVDSVEEYEDIVGRLLEVGAAMDRKMVYWDVRPSEAQPTVEVRVADVLGTVEEAALLAVLVRCLVAEAVESPDPAPRVPGTVISAAQWRAAKDGLVASVPDPRTGTLREAMAVVRDLVDRHSASLKASGELPFVEETLSFLTHNGDGAHRQREAFHRTGSVDGVLRMLARQTSGAT